MRRIPWLVGWLVLSAGCGRPATEQECNEIVTRAASLQYAASNKSDAAVDPARIETIRARVRSAMYKNCVGKRITEDAMACIRRAKSATEIREECLD
jgi:hypothetical protein